MDEMKVLLFQITWRLQVGIYAAVLSASTKSSIYHLKNNKTEE